MKFYKFLVLLVLAFILVSGCTQIKPTDGRQEPVYTEGTLPQTADVKTITVKVVDGANVLVEQPIELPNDSMLAHWMLLFWLQELKCNNMSLEYLLPQLQEKQLTPSITGRFTSTGSTLQRALTNIQ